MKTSYIIILIFFYSCNIKDESYSNQNINDDNSNTNINEYYSNSEIENLDESIIIDSLEIMKYEIGKLNFKDALEVNNLFIQDGWRILSKNEMINLYNQNIIPGGRYWVLIDNYPFEESIGNINDTSNFITNLNEIDDPEHKINIVRLVRETSNIRNKSFYRIVNGEVVNEFKYPLNHLQFVKKKETTIIGNYEVMNKNLEGKYRYIDAVKSVSDIGFRLPNIEESKIIYRYRNLIGGFYDGEERLNYYWTSESFDKNTNALLINFEIKHDLNQKDISNIFFSVEGNWRSFNVRALK